MPNKFVDISQINMPEQISKIDFYQNDGTYEVACSLFGVCNLNCHFCFESHTSKIDIEHILKMPQKIADTIKSDILFHHIDRIIVRIWGGELFFDAIPDEMFSVYLKFAQKLSSIIKNLFSDIDISFAWSSNGVFTKRDRVLKLLKQTHAIICFSYDPYDRFRTVECEQECLNTIEYFHEANMLGGISMTETKKNINACVSGAAKTFEELAQKYSIDLNAYIPNTGYEEFLPSTKELSDFYVWCARKKLYKISILQDVIANKKRLKYNDTNIQRRCRCKLRTVFFPNGTWTHNCVKECSNLPLKCFYGSFQPDESNVTEIKNTLGLMKSGCLYCPYYYYCPSLCWTVVLFSKEKEVCPYKRMLKILEEDKVC